MDSTLIKLLQNSGFTDKESRVYLALLKLGEARVSQIAAMTEMKRPIIYVILEGLIKRGYASEIPGKKITAFKAVDPSVILMNLKNVAKDLTEMLPVLRTLSNQGDKRPKITYHETKEGIWNTWNEMSMAANQFYISDYQKLLKLFPRAADVWEGYAKNSRPPIITRHLITDNEANFSVGRRFKKVRQLIKYLPGVKSFEMDIGIYDNKVGITLLDDKPCIVTIESSGLVNSLLPILEIAWQQAKEI